MITVGILVSYIVNYIFADAGAWRWMLGLAVVPSVILLIGILFMPESPRWLFTIGKEEKAREILSLLRGTKNIDDEIDQMKEAEKENEGGLKELFEPWVRPALIASDLPFAAIHRDKYNYLLRPENIYQCRVRQFRVYIGNGRNRRRQCHHDACGY